MKIEIDLKDVFIPVGDQDRETGYQEAIDVPDAIREAVIQKVIEKIESSVKKRIEPTIDEIISSSIKNQLDAQLASLMPSLFDYEFTETTSWGEKKGTFTVRNRILKAIEEQCVFKNPNGYGSEKNQFTRVIQEIVDKQLNVFKKTFQTEIDAQFTKSALAHASVALQNKLGIK